MTKEVTPQIINSVTIRHPHRMFRLASFGAFHVFETAIAPMVDDRPLDQDAWEARTPLEHLILGQQHAFEVQGIALHVMPKPYDQLAKVQPDGWGAATANAVAKVRGEVVGFAMVCDITPTPEAETTRIRSRLWYAPLGRTRSGLRVADPNGRGLRRFVDVVDPVTTVRRVTPEMPGWAVHPSSRRPKFGASVRRFRPAL